MLERKEVYTLDELFKSLPIGLAELGRKAELNEVSVARIRDRKGKPRRSSMNRLLTAFGQVYQRELSLSNVRYSPEEAIEVVG